LQENDKIITESYIIFAIMIQDQFFFNHDSREVT